MRRTTIMTFALLGGALLGVLILGRPAASNVANAATASEPFAIDWYSIDSGGQSSGAVAGRYTLGGSLGQHDAGVHEGGQYTLEGGFWAGISPVFLGELPYVQR